MEDSMHATHTDVLIVGAGPTGLALAIALQQAGVRYLLIDKLQQGQNTSRAAVIHAHTLDMLDKLGVSQPLAARGLSVSNFSIRDRDRPLVQLNFDKLPSPHPYLLMIPQDVTEAILSERLAALGGVIHRGVTAISLEQGERGARVTLASDDGETVVSARYVVGADGMHSIVRKAADIDFEGDTYGESFVLADVHMSWPYQADEVSLFFSPAGLVVVAPLPGGAFRIVATFDNAPEQPDAADIQALLDARGPTAREARVTDVIWSSRFRVHHRLAASYRQGCFLLMGDAAHVHSPAGGQGMNTGLVDAVVLGELLADAVLNRRPEALDAYESLRRPAAAKVLPLTGRLTRMATMRSAPRRVVRNAILRTLNCLPPFQRKLTMNLSGLSRKELAQVPKQAKPRSDRSTQRLNESPALP
jgi:2-polyprenyl-6-methoxyphenol hydroxylase-like FAD-dependent oxidoreductase